MNSGQLLCRSFAETELMSQTVMFSLVDEEVLSQIENHTVQRFPFCFYVTSLSPRNILLYFTKSATTPFKPPRTLSTSGPNPILIAAALFCQPTKLIIFGDTINNILPKSRHKYQDRGTNNWTGGGQGRGSGSLSADSSTNCSPRRGHSRCDQSEPCLLSTTYKQTNTHQRTPPESDVVCSASEFKQTRLAVNRNQTHK